jgi:serine/threonine protein kinase
MERGAEGEENSGSAGLESLLHQQLQRVSNHALDSGAGAGRIRCMATGGNTHFYKLLSRVDRTHQSDTWRAILDSNGRQREVLVYTFHPWPGQFAAIEQTFLKEMRAIASVRNSTIASVLDYGRFNATNLFIAYEWENGYFLPEILRRLREINVAVPPWFALQICKYACNALSCVHAVTDDDENPLNLLHLHCNPHNIRVSLVGRVSVLQSGIPESLRLIHQGNMKEVFTPCLYTAPELLRNQEATARSDVFSLGVLLYELTSGELPPVGSDPETVLSMIAQPGYFSPDHPVAWFTEATGAVIRKAVAFDPALRFENINALAEEIDRIIFYHDFDRCQEELGLFLSALFPQNSMIPETMKEYLAAREKMVPLVSEKSRTRWAWIIEIKQGLENLAKNKNMISGSETHSDETIMEEVDGHDEREGDDDTRKIEIRELMEEAERCRNESVTGQV